MKTIYLLYTPWRGITRTTLVNAYRDIKALLRRKSNPPSNLYIYREDSKEPVVWYENGVRQ